MAGFFQSNDFIAIRGQRLFQSALAGPKSFYHPRRKILTGKVGYNRIFLKKVRFAFFLETYYDWSQHLMDFSTTLQISFNPAFFITETKFF